MNCPRIICETASLNCWGAPYAERHTLCTLDKGHSEDHAWGESVTVRESDTVR